MWKQWINFILGIVVAVLAAYGAAATWTITGGILIALLALWAGIEGAPSGHMTHAH